MRTAKANSGWLFLVGTMMSLITSTVFADIANPSDTNGMGDLFNAFSRIVRDEIWPALQDTDAYKFSTSLFVFFTVILLFKLVWDYMNDGLDLPEVLNSLFFIGIVQCIMLVYDDATASLWGWADAFGGSIQQAAVGSSDLFFVPGFISGIMSRFSFLDITLWAGLQTVLSMVVLALLTTILSIMSYFCVAWGVWGFTVAKLVGWMFVPMMLFKPLEFLWDGWFRFLMGFLIYTVMARVQLALTAVVFRLFFALPAYEPGNPIPVPEVHHLSEFLGVLVLIVIAICGLLSTGMFATAIAGGVGGFTGQLRTVASGAARGAAKFAKSKAPV